MNVHPLNILDITNNKDLIIYPNPTSEYITIKFKNNKDLINKLEVINERGIIVVYKTEVGKSTSINMTKFAKGVYIVKVNGKDIQKIILQ